MRQMLEAGVHFGHQVRYWNPKMAPYIFGVKHKVHIINLEKTLPLYNDAVNFISSLAAKKGKILFVGTKLSSQDIVRAEADRCGMPYVNYRWLGGMLTNYKTIRQSIKQFKDLEALRDSPTFANLTKKEALTLMRKITKMERNLGGIKDMAGLPEALFIVDVGYEDIAVTEARKLKIPVIGIVDTNNTPDGIDYPVPGNDDSLSAVKLYLQHIADAIIEARSHLVFEQVIAEKDENKMTRKVASKPKGKVVTRHTAAVEHVVVKEDVVTESVTSVDAGDEKEKPVAKKTVVKSEKDTAMVDDVSKVKIKRVAAKGVKDKAE